MDTKTRSIFEGFPQTIQNKDKPKITVRPLAITPLAARIADWLSKTGCFLSMPCVIYAGYHLPLTSPWHYGALAAAPVVSYLAIKFTLYRLFRSKKHLEFTPDYFIVHKIFGKEKFDRSLPHKFALYNHKKAPLEQENLSFRARKRRLHWWSMPLKYYYREAFHLSFEYMGQRIDIMSIYGRKTAQLILMRLNACDEVMDGYSQKGHGQSLTPEGEWSEQSGALNDLF